MEIVLGVSMTPTTVSIALVEGEKADGVIVDHDVFEFSSSVDSATSSPSDHVIAAILGTQEGAIEAGHLLVSTGVAWTDHAEAAVLREALVARGIEDVLLVSEMHAAAALAQTVGRAVGYDKTALMLVERGIATLAVVETADGSVVKVRSHSLQGEDIIAEVAEVATSLGDSAARGMFVVGSGMDVTAVKARLQDLVSVPVITPEEPQLALARGAALASAHAPRYDASTVGLAYSQDPDETAIHPLLLAGDATTFIGPATPDTVHIGSDPDELPEHRKPFSLVGSSLTAVFVAGVMALALALAINVQPASDQGLGVHPEAAAPPTALPSAPPAAPPKGVPGMVTPPAPPAPPPPASSIAARMKVLPAPPPPLVVVRNAAPAPAAQPPVAPAPAAPPPAPPAPPRLVVPPVIPAPILQWLPPVLQNPYLIESQFDGGKGGDDKKRGDGKKGGKGGD